MIEVYKSFYFVLIALIGFSTDGNNLDMGSTRCNILNPIDNYDKHVNGKELILIIQYLKSL